MRIGSRLCISPYVFRSQRAAANSAAPLLNTIHRLCTTHITDMSTQDLVAKLEDHKTTQATFQKITNCNKATSIEKEFAANKLTEIHRQIDATEKILKQRKTTTCISRSNTNQKKRFFPNKINIIAFAAFAMIFHIYHDDASQLYLAILCDHKPAVAKILYNLHLKKKSKTITSNDHIGILIQAHKTAMKTENVTLQMMIGAAITAATTKLVISSTTSLLENVIPQIKVPGI
jgi:hypothetical protein